MFARTLRPRSAVCGSQSCHMWCDQRLISNDSESQREEKTTHPSFAESSELTRVLRCVGATETEPGRSGERKEGASGMRRPLPVPPSAGDAAWCRPAAGGWVWQLPSRVTKISVEYTGKTVRIIQKLFRIQTLSRLFRYCLKYI